MPNPVLLVEDEGALSRFVEASPGEHWLHGLKLLKTVIRGWCECACGLYKASTASLFLSVLKVNI
jgi:hypothetical protein